MIGENWASPHGPLAPPAFHEALRHLEAARDAYAECVSTRCDNPSTWQIEKGKSPAKQEIRQWKVMGCDTFAREDYFVGAFATEEEARKRLRESEAEVEATQDEALRVDPRHVSAHNGAALLLATAPVAAIRNGERAVDLARKAAELSDWNASYVLSTLAAAYAELGHFAEAIRWQEKVLANPEFATSHGEDARQRLDLYRRGEPYRHATRL